MVEKTFVILKPDAVERKLVGKIISRFEDKNFSIKNMMYLNVSSELSDKHYAEHVSKPFYPDLKSYIMSGPVVAMVVEGVSAVSVTRLMVGVTNAAEAAPGTIRGDYGVNTSYNIIHASDSPESAKREIALWFGDDN